MKTPPPIGLRFAMRVLATMAEKNPRLVENWNWQTASQGIAGLIRDIETLRGYNVVPVDFAAEIERIESDQPDIFAPLQLNLQLRAQ